MRPLCTTVRADLFFRCCFKSRVEILGASHFQRLNAHPQGAHGSLRLRQGGLLAQCGAHKGKGGAKAPPFNAQLGWRCIYQRMIACLTASSALGGMMH
jgi:hypothetical protein